MSQKSVELIIGKLATDEELRERFRLDAARTVQELQSSGCLCLTPSELSAVLATDVRRCEEFAGAIDPRLQKASLKDMSGTRRTS